MSDTPQGPGWWMADDQRWYAPEERRGTYTTAPPTTSALTGAEHLFLPPAQSSGTNFEGRRHPPRRLWIVLAFGLGVLLLGGLIFKVLEGTGAATSSSPAERTSASTTSAARSQTEPPPTTVATAPATPTLSVTITAGTTDVDQLVAFFDEHRLQEVLLDVKIGSSPDTALLEARPQDEPAYLFACGASRYGGNLCGDGAEILIHQLVGIAGPDASLDQQHGEWRLQGRFAVQPDGGVHQGITSINLRPVIVPGSASSTPPPKLLSGECVLALPEVSRALGKSERISLPASQTYEFTNPESSGVIIGLGGTAAEIEVALTGPSGTVALDRSWSFEGLTTIAGRPLTLLGAFTEIGSGTYTLTASGQGDSDVALLSVSLETLRTSCGG